VNAPASTPSESPQADESVRFEDFDLAPSLVSAVTELGFEAATPIQACAIPVMLSGRDVIGRARTGSGKTAAFGLPVLQRVLNSDGKGVRAIILAPTRELALQVASALRDFAKHTPGIGIATVYGGASYGPQLRDIRRGASIVVGTPGRVNDLVERGSLDLSNIEIFALDEADEMLQMGFIDVVESLLAATPDSRQIVLFSATMPKPIRRVADRHLQDPVVVQVEEKALTTDHIDQRWIQVRYNLKAAALIRLLLGEERETTLVFTRTRNDASDLADQLMQAGFQAEALHGGLNQSARERILGRLCSKHLEMLIATDVAARGIDVNHITHVINYALPESAEQYVHRIGRTGRAGRAGVAITLVTSNERRRLFQMRSHIRAQINQASVPSIETIQKCRSARLQKKLQQVLTEDHSDATTLMEALQEGGLPAEQIAVAALQLLSQHQAVSIPPDPVARPNRPRPQRLERSERPRRGGVDRCNAVELSVSIGRHQGVRPGDLVGALANEGGISSAQIGRITISDRKSLVGLSEEAAQQILHQLQRLQIRGHQARIARAN
jgi:ATP-dependent RNA helicase DeaD